MATSETRAEMIPIRERERTRVAKSKMARKSQNARETNSILEAILRSVTARPEVAESDFADLTQGRGI